MVTGQCGGAVLAAGELKNVDEHKKSNNANQLNSFLTNTI